MDIFEMDKEYGPKKPNKKAARPKSLKRGTRKKRDKKIKEKRMARVADIERKRKEKKQKQEYYNFAVDIGESLKKKIPTRIKSPIEKNQDKAFKVIEEHNLNLKKSPIVINEKETLARIPSKKKLIIASGQEIPPPQRVFAYDNDPTSHMAPYQYHNYMVAKRKQDKLRRERLMQYQEQMRMNESDSDDDFEDMSQKRREYQKMKSGGKRRKKTRRRRTRKKRKRRKKKTRRRRN